jgi:hypothetical protein
MIQGYMDETGIQAGANVCLIAGYFGGPGQWKKFGEAWTKIITKHNVAEFHAKEFWAFNKDGERAASAYRGWSRDKADSFLEELVAVITSHKVHPVSSTIVVESFNRLSHNQRRFLTGGKLVNGKFKTSGCPSKPYFVPFQLCVVDIADNAAVGGKAHYAFDLNKEFKGYATDLFSLVKGLEDLKVRDRIGGVKFPTGLEAVQLQAADLLCYRSYQYAQKRAAVPDTRPDSLLQELISGTISDVYHTFLDDYGLQVLLQGIDVPPDDAF